MLFCLVWFLFFFTQNQYFLAATSGLCAGFFCRHAADTRPLEKSLYDLLHLSLLLVVAAVVSVTSLHKGSYCIVFCCLKLQWQQGTNQCLLFSSTYYIIFRLWNSWKKVIAVLSPKYFQMYWFICARCLAKLCDYIHISSLAGFREKRTPPVCNANLFLTLILLLKADHSGPVLKEGWSIIF